MAEQKRPSEAEVAAEAAAMYPDTNVGPPTPQEIAEEAHAIYLNRGGEDGRDVEDWLEAERRLRERHAARVASAGDMSRRGTWQERDANRRAHGPDDLKA